MKDRVLCWPKRVETREWNHGYYDVRERTGCCYAFPCDADGRVLVEKLCPEALKNLRFCETSEFVVDDGVREDVSYDWEPGRLRCDCGQVLHWIPSYEPACDRCGREYNASGQLLAPRRFWGEETGETF